MMSTAGMMSGSAPASTPDVPATAEAPDQEYTGPLANLLAGSIAAPRQLHRRPPWAATRVEAPGVEASATQEHMAEIPGPADALAVSMQENMFQAEEHMAEIPGPADEPLPSQPPVPLEVGAADVDLQRATLVSLGHDVDSMDEDFRAALLALVEDEEFVSAMDGSSSSTGASSGSASGSSSSSGGAAGHCSSQRF